jgi:hypothetical protein
VVSTADRPGTTITNISSTTSHDGSAPLPWAVHRWLAEGENGEWKELQVIESKRNAIRKGLVYELLNAQDTVLCSYFAQRSGERNEWQTQGGAAEEVFQGLSEACMMTTRQRMSEGLAGQCILARRLTLAFWRRKGSLEYGCPSTRSSGADGKAHYGLTYGIG